SAATVSVPRFHFSRGQRGAPPGRTRSKSARSSGSASERLSSAVAESAGDSGAAWKRRQLGVAARATAPARAAPAPGIREDNPVPGASSESGPSLIDAPGGGGEARVPRRDRRPSPFPVHRRHGASAVGGGDATSRRVRSVATAGQREEPILTKLSGRLQVG